MKNKTNFLIFHNYGFAEYCRDCDNYIEKFEDEGKCLEHIGYVKGDDFACSFFKRKGGIFDDSSYSGRYSTEEPLICTLLEIYEAKKMEKNANKKLKKQKETEQQENVEQQERIEQSREGKKSK